MRSEFSLNNNSSINSGIVAFSYEITFPVQLTTSRIGNFTLAICDDQTYIHTYQVHKENI